MTPDRSPFEKSPFDKQQAEGARDVVERELRRQEDRRAKKIPPQSRKEVPGRSHRGDAAQKDENGRPE